MANQLPRLRAGGREPEAVDHIVETALEQLQQRFAGNPALAIRHFEVAAELVLQHAINALDLLLFAQLQAVAYELRLAQLSVLSWRQIALLNRALLRIAALPLQEELHSFAPAQPANRSDVTCHSLLILIVASYQFPVASSCSVSGDWRLETSSRRAPYTRLLFGGLHPL